MYTGVVDILPQLIANSLIAGAIYALVAVSFTFTYDPAKFFNLAHGAMAVVAAYAVLFLTRWLGVNTAVAIVAGVLSAGVIGYTLESFIYLPLRRRGASNRVLLIASLGVLIVVQAIMAMLFTSQFQTLAIFSESLPTYTIAGGVITAVQLVMLVIALVVAVGLSLIMRYTTFGRAVQAIADDREVAEVVGIDTERIIGKVFFIGSCIVGLAGILIGYDTGIEPLMGMGLLLSGYVAAVVGGIGSLSGAVLGAFILGFVENFGIWKLSGEWKSAIAFSLLIVFLIFRPRGLIQK